jgi:hypothetical protein
MRKFLGVAPVLVTLVAFGACSPAGGARCVDEQAFVLRSRGAPALVVPVTPTQYFASYQRPWGRDSVRVVTVRFDWTKGGCKWSADSSVVSARPSHSLRGAKP